VSRKRPIRHATLAQVQLHESHMTAAHSAIDRYVASLAEWAATTAYVDIPSPVIEDAKRGILDVVGVALAGATMPIAATARRRALLSFRDGRCAVVGGPERLVSAGAAFANAAAAHALDFDDTSYAGFTHTSCVVLPAALAAAEHLERSGEDLLVAFVVGTEVELRLGLLFTNDVYLRGWWTTGVLGALGSAAAVARVHRLDASGLRGALSFAAGAAAGLRQCLGTPAKPIYAGHASEVGVRAGELIALEALQMPDLFGGRAGFGELFSDGPLDGSALDGLGSSYVLSSPGLACKTYPVCSAAQAAVQAVEEILAREDLDGTDVARVACEVPPIVEQSLRFPRPETVAEAQFSLPFAVGCVLAFGRLTPDLLREDIIGDARLSACMSRVEMVRAPALGSHEDLEGAAVTVTCKDGQVLRCRKRAARGTAAAPLSKAELTRKFEMCVRLALPDDDVAARFAQIWSLEDLPNCDQLLGDARGF
jgi:2-methylcitrate dehydratase PrpD